ncbi:exosortase/archaeosortase family protein [Alicyclobacillus cycloheptanicus]|uniref:Exosortase/archaeosortase family protein n=1 Tax=Alicyclobacillus cycloheptanicus TaxID=1457 RepID=A0ABT9XEU1_9BACL|nr:exosortase/archaeosortase family protein [Alicyclobacillus cycloheptanicus]MDQ0188811.1 exosortase/archaeosortase family protein [Alicyclobacillus cycloheptanicus]WDM00540.1 exosortase/archaeosortase family protein [Alicyclobacillus cycloheptanicus]
MTNASWQKVRRFERLGFVWVLASIIPVAPYAIPLFQGSLSDSPRAYLAWIPVLGFGWALWNLRQTSVRVPKTSQSIPGIPLTIVTGFLLFAGRFLWPHTLVGDDVGLLLWPLWSLGLFWVLFGVRATRLIFAPLCYLCLVWPPVFLRILSLVNPPLQNVVVRIFTWMSDGVSWMRPGLQPDVFDVTWGVNNVTHVVVTQACSGSDSILAMVILFPVVLVLFPIPLRKKLVLVLGGAVLVFVGNLLRLAIILFALHQFGLWFAFKILHPLLGTVLFLLVASGLLVFGTRRQLRAPHKHAHATSAAAREAGATVRDSGAAGCVTSIAPQAWPPVFAAGLAVLLSIGLFPMYLWSTGTELRPRSLPSRDLSTLLPALPGYGLQRVDDPGAQAKGVRPLAARYVSASGSPAITVSLRWASSQAARGRGFPDPLLQAGDTVLRQEEVSVQRGISGTAYEVARRSPDGAMTQRVDTVFCYDVVYQYRRGVVEVAVQSAMQPDGRPGEGSPLRVFEERFGSAPAS